MARLARDSWRDDGNLDESGRMRVRWEPVDGAGRGGRARQVSLRRVVPVMMMG